MQTKIDLSLPYNHMFSAASKRALSIKVHFEWPERNISNSDGSCQTIRDKTQFFSLIAHGEDQIYTVSRKITDEINSLASKGYVTGCYKVLFALKLETLPHELEKYIVAIAVSLSPLGVDETTNSQAALPKLPLYDLNE